MVEWGSLFQKSMSAKGFRICIYQNHTNDFGFLKTSLSKRIHPTRYAIVMKQFDDFQRLTKRDENLYTLMNP